MHAGLQLLNSNDRRSSGTRDKDIGKQPKNALRSRRHHRHIDRLVQILAGNHQPIHLILDSEGNVMLQMELLHRIFGENAAIRACNDHVDFRFLFFQLIGLDGNIRKFREKGICGLQKQRIMVWIALLELIKRTRHIGIVEGHGAVLLAVDIFNRRRLESIPQIERGADMIADALDRANHRVDRNLLDRQQGINRGSNYTGSGAKLAFGNANTGTALQNESWNGNTLNQYNHSGNGLLGCTFGLVTGLNSEGHIIYANGVDAPNLFDDGSANGKRTYTDWSLGFNRSGDTYTLSSVNGANLDGLEYFNNPQTPGKDPYTHIWTNNFWPMDGRPGIDGRTGKHDDRGDYVGYGGNNMYPTSDDGLAHNNMFGMQYSVEFELTEDYVGPLEYYFFGDDDMWVFLDGRLVCDIGGVHSSVGAYVNLWDYIAKGDAGKHTLKFYYTERGLSGSTCYMQFTLPSVSSVPPTYQNGQLKVQKEVVGEADPDTEFSFDINIWSDDGSAQGSDYSIARYNPKGEHIESSLLSDGKGTFKLKADEYVIIDYLQHGTHYTIKETNTDGFTVSNTIDNGNPNQSAEVTGTTPVGKNSIVLFTNTCRPKLPNTGGPGTIWYTFGGIALIVFPSMYVAYRRRKRNL